MNCKTVLKLVYLNLLYEFFYHQISICFSKIFMIQVRYPWQLTCHSLLATQDLKHNKDKNASPTHFRFLAALATNFIVNFQSTLYFMLTSQQQVAIVSVVILSSIFNFRMNVRIKLCLVSDSTGQKKSLENIKKRSEFYHLR